MSITDIDKAKACLDRIGYYRLSAYWYPFRKSTEGTGPDGNPVTIVLDDFKDGADFTTAIDLYVFDKKLRLLVIDAVERVEIALRTDIALLLGTKSPQAHRLPKFLHGNFARRPKPGSLNTKHHEWLARQDDKFMSSREDFAKHFKERYPGEHPPIWIAVELWDFGLLSNFYGGMDYVDMDKIARNYGIPNGGRVMKSWIHCLNDVRNNCAHHSRLWNKPLVNRPTWPTPGTIAQLVHVDSYATTRLYAALAILNIMLQTVNPTSTWCKRLIEHLHTLPKSPYWSLQSMGFPTNWEAQPIWSP
ncbi:Abi family protein [Agrobacterium vitis]|nr:Abi family protein [Allorhizobium ampelinum]